MIDKSASDLTKRLYETPLYYGYGEASALGEEAADEITALTAEVERLRAALEEITKKGGPDLAGCITIARAALTPAQEKTDD